MAVSHFLLSVFEFAADQPGNVFLKEDWLAFAPENGAWFYRLYERDTENGKNMHRAVDRLFRMEQLEEWLKDDIKRNDAMQSVWPGRYLEGEYMKWIMEKQLKAFYAELKSGCQCVSGGASRIGN